LFLGDRHHREPVTLADQGQVTKGLRMFFDGPQSNRLIELGQQANVDQEPAWVLRITFGIKVFGVRIEGIRVRVGL